MLSVEQLTDMTDRQLRELRDRILRELAERSGEAQEARERHRAARGEYLTGCEDVLSEVHREHEAARKGRSMFRNREVQYRLNGPTLYACTRRCTYRWYRSDRQWKKVA